MVPIVKVEVIPVRLTGADLEDCDSTVDTVVVRLTDAEGRTGIGECDAAPEPVRAFIEMPKAHLWSQRMADLLVGADPTGITALWERLYEATLYSGRRGLGIHALSGIDIALHDLAGKQLGLPAYQLMGGARRSSLRPYCTIYPGLPKGRSLRDLCVDAPFVVDIGARLAANPRLRQRVRSVPGRVANPVWVDDAAFDLDYHVRRSALPAPGSPAMFTTDDAPPRRKARAQASSVAPVVMTSSTTAIRRPTTAASALKALRTLLTR